MDNTALFSVHPEAASRIKLAMVPDKLPKDKVGGYKYDAAIAILEIIKGVLEDQYCEETTDVIKGLLDETPNELIKFKVNMAIKAANVHQ